MSDTSEPAPGASSGPRTGVEPASTAGRRLAFWVFVLSPLAVLAVLVALIAISLERGPRMHEPPVGAGAGHTGMSNEFGGGSR